MNRTTSQHRWLKRLLITTAVVEIMVGLLHFAMPYFVYASSGFQQLTSSERDFVTLVTFATGILLIAFGAVTLLLAKHMAAAPRFVVGYLGIKVVLWFGRIILELLYPATLDMFYIDPFTRIVMPGLIVEVGLFVGAWVLARRLLSAENSHA